MNCPNCKELYVRLNSTEKDYPVRVMHENSLCPFGIEIHHYTLKEAIESAREHILERFPWITRDHSHLRANLKDKRAE